MRKLTPKQERFVAEYLIDLNATQAAIRAGYSARTAEQQGPRLLGNVGVAAAIQKARVKREGKLEISAELVLQQWWELANVDVREIIEYKRGACRYCWGEGHLFQWTQSELDEAIQAVLDTKDKTPPDSRGGVGYSPNSAPNPDCPRCAGDGQGRVVMHDTRNLSPAAAKLYAGVQIGKDGLKALTEARDKAREMIAKHLGMFKERVEHSGTVSIASLIEGSFGKGEGK